MGVKWLDGTATHHTHTHTHEDVWITTGEALTALLAKGNLTQETRRTAVWMKKVAAVCVCVLVCVSVCHQLIKHQALPSELHNKNNICHLV